jgi:hypothetical protein
VVRELGLRRGLLSFPISSPPSSPTYHFYFILSSFSTLSVPLIPRPHLSLSLPHVGRGGRGLKARSAAWELGLGCGSAYPARRHGGTALGR